jgi:hypothetical protein
VLAKPAQELDRCKMKRVECPHRGREGIDRACENVWRELEEREPAEQEAKVVGVGRGQAASV